MKTIVHGLVALMALSVAGCSTSPAQKPEVPATLEPVELGDHHPTVKLPDPETNEGHVGRKPRRLSVAQLRESILTTTGRQWSQINTLAASLGQADFALTVSDSTEANLVFAKFLEDGAREVCIATANADFNKAAGDRILWPDVAITNRDFTTMSDAAIATNLSTLALRFWGQPFNPQELTEWTTMFKTIAARARAVNKPEQAWGSMCVAFMTDSRFITY